MKKVAFILDGRRRKKEKLKKEVSEKLSGDFEVNFFETQYPREAIDLAAKATGAEADFLIVAGGDGLLNEAVNGYMQCDEEKRKKVVLGTLPFGTGNDFSKTIDLTGGLDQVISLIKNESSKPLDLGLMHFNDLEGNRSSRYFINIADVGIGGYASKRVNESSKLLGSNLSYMKAIVLSFLTYKHKKVKIEADTFEWQGPILLACMANAKYFGSGLCIAPQAVVDDGKLQMVILGNVSLLDYLKNMSKVKRGEIIEHPEVQYLQATRCKINGLEGECTIDMDGEFIGYTPIEVQTVKGAVSFLR